jgi:hypothetical protein
MLPAWRIGFEPGKNPMSKFAFGPIGNGGEGEGGGEGGDVSITFRGLGNTLPP